MATIAGMVIVVVALLVASVTEVAVIVAVCAELVAAGAVKVAALEVWLDNAPAPLNDHFTPALFLSWATVAVKLTESLPSTVVDVAVMVTPSGAELPPQPVMATIALKIPAHIPTDTRSEIALPTLRRSAALCILIPPSKR
jgi:hypothetical protein